MRLEKGFKLWGAEMNMDTTAIDAGLMNFVNMEKVSMQSHFVQFRRELTHLGSSIMSLARTCDKCLLEVLHMHSEVHTLHTLTKYLTNTMNLTLTYDKCLSNTCELPLSNKYVT